MKALQVLVIVSLWVTTMHRLIFLLAITIISNSGMAYNYKDGQAISKEMHAKAMQELKNIKSPKELMGKIFKGIPKESNLNPATHNDELKKIGAEHLQSSDLGILMLNQAKERARQKTDKNTSEVDSANEILKYSDVMTNGGCYKVPSQCTTKNTKKYCNDSVSYNNQYSYNHLSVALSATSLQFRAYRSTFGNTKYSPVKVDLTRCGKHESSCSKKDLVKITKGCEKLKIKITRLGNSHSKRIYIIKKASCSSPSVEFYDNSSGWVGSKYSISVQEIKFRDEWIKEAPSQQAKEICYPTGETKCIEPKATKKISGISVTRKCWREQENYQCMHNIKGSCDKLLKQGCTQSGSICIDSTNKLCNKYSQTFMCSITTCSDEKEICTEAVDCADGNCHTDAKKESSKKSLADGLVNLSALVGSAKNIKDQNLSSGLPHIFSSSPSTCRRAWGVHPRNCCSGNKDFLCSKGERDLYKKIEAGLAIRVKRARHDDVYCSREDVGICTQHSEVWCVFKSRLAYLVRVEGGKKQLHVGFGRVSIDSNNADCKGLTPDQLSKVNLGDIELGDLEKDLPKKYKMPSTGSVIDDNLSRIEELKRRGRNYD